MSWWWIASLGVGSGGAGLLALVGRRLAAEARAVGGSAVALAAQREQLVDARQRLVIDASGHCPTETRPAHR